MYMPTTRAIALPGGCMFEMVGRYGFLGLPERTWVLGARPLRQIMRLLDLSQPRRRLSGETSILTVPELTEEWDAFTYRDRFTRIGECLGALEWMTRDSMR